MSLSQVSLHKIWQNITIRNYFFEFELFCIALYNFHILTFFLVNSSNIMCQTWWKISVIDFNSMVKIPLSDNFIDQQISFSLQCFLRVPFLIMTLQFLNIFFSSSSILFSSSSFSFPLFSFFLFLFLFFVHFLSLFSSFFLFPNLHHFLNLVCDCRFLRASLPCSRTFLLPCFKQAFFSVYAYDNLLLMTTLMYT